MTVTPVLADQLEDAGVRGAPARASWSSWRIGAAEADVDEVAARVPRRLRGRAASATAAPWSCSTRPAATRCAPSSEAAAEGRVALAASAATHAVLPLLATRAGLRLQLDAGHPLAPAPLRLGRRLLAARVRLRAGPRVARWPSTGSRWFCVDQSAHERAARRRWRRSRPRPGPVALPIDWEAVSWLWSLDGYPSDPAYAQFAGKSLRGIRLWKIGGGAYDPAAAAARGAAPGRRVPRRRRRPPARLRRRARAPRPARLRDRHRAARPLVVGGADLAARRCSAGAEAAGVRLLTVPQALAEHEPERAAARRLELGRGQGPRAPGTRRRSPTSPGRARRLELRLLRALAGGPPRRRRARAPRASCWPPGQRLGLPRRPRPGGRLRLPARHRPRRGAARGHRLPRGRRPAHALARPGPEPRSAAGALARRR